MNEIKFINLRKNYTTNKDTKYTFFLKILRYWCKKNTWKFDTYKKYKIFIKYNISNTDYSYK